LDLETILKLEMMYYLKYSVYWVVLYTEYYCISNRI